MAMPTSRRAISYAWASIVYAKLALAEKKMWQGIVGFLYARSNGEYVKMAMPTSGDAWMATPQLPTVESSEIGDGEPLERLKTVDLRALIRRESLDVKTNVGGWDSRTRLQMIAEIREARKARK